MALFYGAVDCFFVVVVVCFYIFVFGWKTDVYLIPAKNIDCGYSLIEAVLTSTNNLYFKQLLCIHY